MYLLLVVFPLFGSLFAGLLGRYLGYRGAALISTFCVFSSCMLSWVAFYEVGLSGSPCYIKLAPWFHSEMFDASWGFLFDSLTVVMLIVVTSISSLVHLYSISYMGEDPHLPRFMSYLSIFTFFMLVLVTADNFIQMFLGWEGIGLASYLLINFWVTRLQASKAAIKAMLVNKVGDFGLALGIMTIFLTFKTVDYTTVFACASSIYEKKELFSFFSVKIDLLTLISLLLFVGVVGKSSQIGLHTWLPDAMEGPTPVSALIHAATLVTAGVFLMARCSPILEYAPDALIVITVMGACTSFLAATTGILQNDLKRVIAYSTCSQLGYMVFACGISNYSVGIFHLMNHAFFKALLFLSAGSIIHALADEQDMRKMGGCVQLLPYTYGMVLIGSMSLTGFPFLTGFYSKDVILELAYAKYTVSGNFAYWLGSLSVFFTSYYSFRLLYMAFIGPVNGYKSSMKQIHDAGPLLAQPLIPLALGSLFIGFLGKDMMIGSGSHFWGNALFTLPQNSIFIESEYIPQEVKYLPLVLTLLGAIVAYLINISESFILNISYPFIISNFGRLFYSFFNKRWLFDKVYNEFIAKPLMQFGYEVSFKALDKGAIEILGPYGISKMITNSKVSKLQSGFIYHYALIMLIGLTFLIYISSSDTPVCSKTLYVIYLITFLFFNSFLNEE
uniref:NADH-ubiquinone oxidoreductase chain 5 n=1 Tax=Cymbomonas tetramitiformis TaxID=36881 RepID=A0A1S5R1W8_9CHLO|nr:NADH dehydrogenase subunit 5 [Cymbomonas tetramitiformis]ANA57075.1 NADH dehydrogenase subunit 5 [Cymbomonas tetramitiformis]